MYFFFFFCPLFYLLVFIISSFFVFFFRFVENIIINVTKVVILFIFAVAWGIRFDADTLRT